MLWLQAASCVFDTVLTFSGNCVWVCQEVAVQSSSCLHLWPCWCQFPTAKPSSALQAWMAVAVLRHGALHSWTVDLAILRLGMGLSSGWQQQHVFVELTGLVFMAVTQ
jgi:hypothetical protein